MENKQGCFSGIGGAVLAVFLAFISFPLYLVALFSVGPLRCRDREE